MADLTDPVTAVQTGFIKMRESGKFCDFEIRCGPHSYKVHKSLICAQSDYFCVACSGFKEGEANMITLKAIDNDPEDGEGCDDPEAIKLMIHFFYHFDYTGPLVEYMDQRRTRSYSGKVRQKGSGYYVDGPPELVLDESDCSTITHAKVFAAAVKYQVPALQALAYSKFQDAAHKAWDNVEFCEAVQIVYTTTPDTRRELRDVVVATVMAHRSLLDKPEMSAVTFSIEGLAYELLQKCLASPAKTCSYCQN